VLERHGKRTAVGYSATGVRRSGRDHDNRMTAEVLRYAAFTDAGNGGNPAGVVLDATSLNDSAMLAIAREVGYSETAFLVPSETAALRVHYFSPLAEVAFCGHATVAAAVALADRDGPSELDLITLAGSIRVTTRATAAGMVATLISPPTRTSPATEAALSEALASIGWEPSDLDPTYPPHVAFAGNNHLVLGVKAFATLAGLDYDFDGLAQLMRQEEWTTVHMFWAEGDGCFNVRNAFPPGGVVEDPATGAAAAAFGGYLRSLGLVSLPARLTLLQGREMHAPSRLLVDLDPNTDTVRVSGAATRMTRAEE
jgi:PhzF family phenazine biosynthesis protein